jgi:hypothetical protein
MLGYDLTTLGILIVTACRLIAVWILAAKLMAQ